MIDSFVPAVPDRELDDLRSRLLATRWPDRETDPRQGVLLDRMRELCDYWSGEYDWRRCERRLTDLGLFQTVIDGVRIVFLHAPSSRSDALPLLLTHGWPGSIVEFLDALDLLRPAGFSCVVPCLPGYGWSGRPTDAGWGVDRIAHSWAELMSRLGYDRYGAAGSDWGTSVTAALGQIGGQHVAGIHLVPPLAPPLPGRPRTPEVGRSGEDGYSTEQRTRPQTIGYSSTDSPVGLAAWIVEKIDSWADPRSDLGPDTVLDNVMHYWLTRTGASAARLYWESLDDVSRWIDGPLRESDLVHAPAGGSVFPYELQRPSRDEAEQRFTDIRYWGTPTIGGHFAAWEQPDVFTAELAAFFDLVR